MERDTSIGGPHDRFPSTRASLLEAVASGPGNEALERVIQLYWKPVYRFIRFKFGKNNEDAKDLTQGFFTSALERDFFARFDPDKASFRTYLRMAVEHFAANEHAAAQRQKRGGDYAFEPIEEHEVAGESPEDVFEREWRRQLLSLGVEDLRAYCAEHDKHVQWQVFEAYDLADDDRPGYADLAALHGIAVTSITNYLAWARRLLRGFVIDRLRSVTASEQELRQEVRRIWN